MGIALNFNPKRVTFQLRTTDKLKSQNLKHRESLLIKKKKKKQRKREREREREREVQALNESQLCVHH